MLGPLELQALSALWHMKQELGSLALPVNAISAAAAQGDPSGRMFGVPAWPG